MPDTPLSPSKGCKPEELRVWAGNMFMKFEEEAMKIQQEQAKQKFAAEQKNLGDGELRKALETLNKKFDILHHDSKTDGAKAQVEDLETKVKESVSLVHKFTRDNAMDLHKLRAELAEYTARIESNGEWLKRVESDFKTHVE